MLYRALKFTTQMLSVDILITLYRILVILVLLAIFK